MASSEGIQDMSLSVIRCQVNHEMIWPTNRQKQLFDNNVDSMELHFKL